MRARPVLIVAPADDFHAAAVTAALKRRHVATEWIDSAELNKTLRLSCSLDDIAAASLTLSGGAAALFIGFRHGVVASATPSRQRRDFGREPQGVRAY